MTAGHTAFNFQTSTYTAADGKPQSSSSFRRSDLLTLAEALRKAHNRAFEIAAEGKQPVSDADEASD